jgi:hypothetical protein
MSPGERAALEGLLTQSRPRLALEIGTADAESLARIAAHAAEVHSFAAVRPPDADDVPPTVTFHAGDPATLLPAALDELAAAGRNVDFVLLDGRAPPGRTRSTLEALLDSPALSRSLILMHPVAGAPELGAVRFAAWPKVARVEPDFLPGCLLRAGHQLAGGLALVLVDAAHLRYQAGPVVADRAYPAAALLAEVRDYVVARERAHGPGAGYSGTPVDPAQARLVDELERELADAEREIRRLRSVARHHEDLWRALMDSWSWRLTEPIRIARDRVRGGG